MNSLLIWKVSTYEWYNFWGLDIAFPIFVCNACAKAVDFVESMDKMASDDPKIRLGQISE